MSSSKSHVELTQIANWIAEKLRLLGRQVRKSSRKSLRLRRRTREASARFSLEGVTGRTSFGALYRATQEKSNKGINSPPYNSKKNKDKENFRETGVSNVQFKHKAKRKEQNVLDETAILKSKANTSSIGKSPSVVQVYEDSKRNKHSQTEIAMIAISNLHSQDGKLASASGVLLQSPIRSDNVSETPEMSDLDSKVSSSHFFPFAELRKKISAKLESASRMSYSQIFLNRVSSGKIKDSVSASVPDSERSVSTVAELCNKQEVRNTGSEHGTVSTGEAAASDKLQSAVLQWKEVSMKEERNCDRCGRIAITRKVNENVNYCGFCRLQRAKELKKGWGVKYVTIMRQFVPTVFQKSIVQETVNQLSEQEHFCRQCGKAISNIHELANTLVKETYHRPFTADLALSWGIIQMFRCVICGLKANSSIILMKHALSHFTDGSPLYCPECQKAISELSIDSISDAGEGSCVQANSKESVSGRMATLVGKASLLGVKIGLSDKTHIPICGSCNKIFDHLLPLIQKIVQFRLEINDDPKVISDGKRCYYYCLICCQKTPKKASIEEHALDHIINGDVCCRSCQKYKNKRNAIGTFVDSNVGRELTQMDESQSNLDSSSYAEMEDLSSFINEDEVTDEDHMNIFHAVVQTLEATDFEGDNELLESITSSEWNFAYAYVEDDLDRNDEFSPGVEEHTVKTNEKSSSGFCRMF